MWDQLLPRPFAGLGRALETRIAPPFYRRTQVVTPSDSTRDELLAIGFEPERVTAVDNGVEPFFTPGERRSDAPTIVATARLAPVKGRDEEARRACSCRGWGAGPRPPSAPKVRVSEAQKTTARQERQR